MFNKIQLKNVIKRSNIPFANKQIQLFIHFQVHIVMKRNAVQT